MDTFYFLEHHLLFNLRNDLFYHLWHFQHLRLLVCDVDRDFLLENNRDGHFKGVSNNLLVVNYLGLLYPHILDPVFEYVNWHLLSLDHDSLVYDLFGDFDCACL